MVQLVPSSKFSICLRGQAQSRAPLCLLFQPEKMGRYRLYNQKTCIRISILVIGLGWVTSLPSKVVVSVKCDGENDKLFLELLQCGSCDKLITHIISLNPHKVLISSIDKISVISILQWESVSKYGQGEGKANMREGRCKKEERRREKKRTPFQAEEM